MKKVKRAKRKLAVGYCRVSTADQAENGVSLEAQRARISSWAVASGYELGGTHVDAGLSGGKASNRPALQAALDEVCREGGALVVYSLSRLARSVPDTLSIATRLERAGADLVSLSESLDTTTAAGKMMFRMMAVLAEFERDQDIERTTMALAYKREQGERISRFAPVGYRFDGDRVIPDEAAGESIRRALELRGNGLSWSKIARTMDVSVGAARRLVAASEAVQ